MIHGGEVGATTIDRLLRAVAASGLATTALTLPDEPLLDREWRWLASLVSSKRLSGRLLDAVLSGRMAATPTQIDLAGEQHTREMTGSILLERMLLEVVDRFEARGIEHRVLKGPAAAHLDHPDPALRSFGDIDLLVRSSQFDDAADVLRATGFARRYPQPRPGFDRRFSKGAAFVAPDQFELDLHRTLAMGPFGLTIDLDDLWCEPQTFEIGGRTLFALGPEKRFLHACYHAALGDVRPRLVALRDLAQILERDSQPVDRDEIRRLANRWRGDAVLARGVVLATDELELTDEQLSLWARERTQSRADRRALITYLDPELGYAARTMASIRVIEGMRAKASFLWSLAFPERPYVEGRHPSRRQRWRSALREARRAWRTR